MSQARGLGRLQASLLSWLACRSDAESLRDFRISPDFSFGSVQQFSHVHVDLLTSSDFRKTFRLRSDFRKF